MSSSSTATASQQNSLFRFKDFLDSKAVVFKLAGGGGTGKSWTLHKMVSMVNKPIILAPTGNAVGLLQKNTKHRVRTHASFLSLRPEQLDVNGMPVFSKIKSDVFPKIQNKTVFFCDEASMMDQEMIDYYIDMCSHYGAKIVLIGDHCQLPSIQDTNNGHVMPYFYGFNGSTLNETVRQRHDNPSLAVTMLSRIMVLEGMGGTDEEIDECIKVYDGIATAFKLPSYKSLGSKRINTLLGEKPVVINGNSGYRYLKSIDQAILNSTDVNQMTAIAFRNDTVNALSLKIRTIKGNVNIKENSVLVGKQTLGSIYNAVRYIVKDIEEYEDFYICKITDEDGMVIIRRARVWKDNTAVNILPQYISMLNSYNREKSSKFSNPLKLKALMEDISEFRLKNITVSDIVMNNYRMQRVFAYAEAITVHFSQGASLFETAIDLKDIMSVSNEGFMKRLLYVASSRHTNYLNIF